jgi:hypothetical protein
MVASNQPKKIVQQLTFQHLIHSKHEDDAAMRCTLLRLRRSSFNDDRFCRKAIDFGRIGCICQWIGMGEM